MSTNQPRSTRNQPSRADRLFGTYHELGSAIEAWPVGLKYLIVLGLTLPAFIAQFGWVTLGCLLLTGLLLLAARLGWRGLLLPTSFYLLLAVIVLFQGLTGDWLLGLRTAANLALALLAVRLLTMTTPIPRLVDALVTVVSPLRRFGFPAARFGLAVSIMLRSIPYLGAAWGTIRQAALARGLGRHLAPQATWLVVRAVDYAQATGDAMAARGLGDD